MIKINNLDVFINKIKIISQVSFVVKKPSIIGFLGPNGAGKSTLINAICGLPNYKTCGEISIFDKNIKDWSYQDLAKKRAILPQKFDLPFPFKVNEVVMMGAYPHNSGRLTKNDILLLNKALRELDIFDLKERFFTSLSGGQKQRVLIARVLLQISYEKETEKLVLLDEPTSNLDWKYQIQIAKMAKDLVSKNCYVFVSLHDVNLALNFCDYLLILKEGKKISYLDVHQSYSEKEFEVAYDLDLEMINGLNKQKIIQPSWYKEV
ncbi:MAG: hypothetical protein COB02_16235 [Candidatus Cloacimonadota bacterium]|nr:MAG: hypothetical protein COB02_16235 [Candidatus Cloacimonadota bacterium]